jgi:hypothetical protein
MPRPRARVQYQLAVVEPAPTRLPQRVVPAVDPWVAGEMFFSPHVQERRRGLALLLGSEATRRSPLVPQLLIARVDEPDLGLRGQIIQALSDYFEVRERQYRYPPEFRAVVVGCLRKFDRPHWLALLELQSSGRPARLGPEALKALLERIPDASARLAQLAGDRSVAPDWRCAAIEVIGQVGFTDTLPLLAGLEIRLLGCTAGQLTLGFAPLDQPEDQALLPALKDTLRRLREAG